MVSRLFYTFLFITFVTYSLAQHLPDGDDDDETSDAWVATSRDFTDRCNEMAEFAGARACQAFMKCCSEGQALNKLNGDRCQIIDSGNACTMRADSTGIQWSSCKAHNCTAEVTTTTTTTRRPMASYSSSASAFMSVGSIIIAGVLSCL